MRSRLATALVYPAALALTAMAVVLALMIAVVPKVVEQFDSLGRELPWLTGAVIALSDFLVGYGLVLLAALVLAGLAFARGLRRPGFRLAVDRTVLRLPLVGRLLRDMHAARMARTLGIMLNAGVPLVEALDSVGGAAGNSVYAMATDKIQQEVSTGTSLTAAMTNANVFPSMVLQMCAIGEESGSIDHMLGKAADFYEAEVDDMVAGLSSLMEPIIIVFLGTLIGGIVVSMYLPIFKLGQVV